MPEVIVCVPIVNAAQIGVGFVRFTANQTQTETVEQTDIMVISAPLISGDESVDSRACHKDGIGGQSLDGQRRAAHGDDRHIQTFSFKETDFRCNP